MDPEITALQDRLGHAFKEAGLLERALTHRSALHDDPSIPENNQRLEFLGDAVLQLVLTHELFALYPAEREGVLSKRRAILSSGVFLADLARALGMDRCLRLALNEESTGGRSRDAALEDAFEAVVGALYLDAGLETARKVILGIYGDIGSRLSAKEAHQNPKGRLQELIQPVHGNDAVRYEVERFEGADHVRTFEVAVFLHDKRLGSGRGNSKKTAEEAAARAALESLQGGASAAG